MDNNIEHSMTFLKIIDPIVSLNINLNVSLNVQRIHSTHILLHLQNSEEQVYYLSK